MKKIAAYGIAWIPVSMVESFLTTEWTILDFTRRQMSYNDVIAKKPLVLISFNPPKHLLEAESIKWIISPGAGVDNLPVRNILSSGKIIINSHANSSSVAEQAWGLLLAACKKITKYDNIIRLQGTWPDRSSQIKDLSSDLTNKTIGILGYGPVGQLIEKYSLAFSMNPIVFTRSPSKDKFQYTDLITKADELDFIVVAAPLTKETKMLINQEIINNLPSHCILVNIARGEIVDEIAIFEALREGLISYYSSDVWTNSPVLKSESGTPPEELIDIPNLVLSPHRAWVSKDSYARVAQQIAIELDNITKGIKSENLVNVSLDLSDN